jgi:hypothetical protein
MGKEKLIAFHIDMNIGQFTKEYLLKWIKILSDAGYNALVWEVENNVKWETCPECAAPEAFEKTEFKEILKISADYGFKNIPLFQTIGHCEYVMNTGKYDHLREVPHENSKLDIHDPVLLEMVKSTGQYCSSNPDVFTFLNAWIDEYLGLFENPEYFHIGADEAFLLGTCEKCLERVNKKSFSDLYISHIRKLYEPLIAKGIKPIIWSDMILKYNESLNELSRDVYLCDWNYYNSHRFKKIWVWGKGFVEINELPQKTVDKFGDFIFPCKDRSKVNYYYTSDFLLKNGFKVICAPSSSCYNDTHGAIGECVFAPHEEIHPANSFDFSQKGVKDAEGVLLTSWSVHLHPWEMQINSIFAPGYVAKESNADFNTYEAWFLKNTFGDNTEEYLSLTRLFNPACIFSYGSKIKFGLGYGKSAEEVPLEWINEKLKTIEEDDLLDEFLVETGQKLKDYQKALKGFKRLKGIAAKNVEYLEYWIFAGELMVNRAKAVLALLESRISNAQIDKKAIKTLISECERLKNKYKNLYLKMQKPFRADQITRWVFDSLLHELKNLVYTENRM